MTSTPSPHRTPPPQRQGVIQRHNTSGSKPPSPAPNRLHVIPHNHYPPGHEALSSLVDVAVQQPQLPVPHKEQNYPNPTFSSPNFPNPSFSGPSYTNPNYTNVQIVQQQHMRQHQIQQAELQRREVAYRDQFEREHREEQRALRERDRDTRGIEREPSAIFPVAYAAGNRPGIDRNDVSASNYPRESHSMSRDR